jgi:hypothetical protein
VEAAGSNPRPQLGDEQRRSRSLRVAHRETLRVAGSSRLCGVRRANALISPCAERRCDERRTGAQMRARWPSVLAPQPMSALQTPRMDEHPKRPSPVAGLSVLGVNSFQCASETTSTSPSVIFDGGLIVNRVPRHRHAGGPFFCVSHGIVRQVLVIQVRKHRKNQPVPALYRHRSAASSRRSPPRRWGPAPCSRRSFPRRPPRAATARGPPVRTAASSSTDTDPHALTRASSGTP